MQTNTMTKIPTMRRRITMTMATTTPMMTAVAAVAAGAAGGEQATPLIQEGVTLQHYLICN